MTILRTAAYSTIKTPVVIVFGLKQRLVESFVTVWKWGSCDSDSKMWWHSVTVIVKCGRTVAQCNSDLSVVEQ